MEPGEAGRQVGRLRLRVVLGLVLGYVFAFTWEAFARAEERLQDTRLFPVVRGLARKAGRYLVARALLLANLALLAGVLTGCVLLSGRMETWRTFPDEALRHRAAARDHRLGDLAPGGPRPPRQSTFSGV